MLSDNKAQHFGYPWDKTQHLFKTVKLIRRLAINRREVVKKYHAQILSQLARAIALSAWSQYVHIFNSTRYTKQLMVCQETQRIAITYIIIQNNTLYNHSVLLQNSRAAATVYNMATIENKDKL